MSSEIVIKKDGSGTIAIVYRISEELLNIGTLDGTKNKPAIPVAEEDFMRAIDRIHGLSVKKFSSEKRGQDIVYEVTLGFDTLEALAKFIDTQGQHGRISEDENGKRNFLLIFSPGADNYSSEIRELVPVVFEGYDFSISVNTPGDAAVSFYDRTMQKLDKPAVGSASVTRNGVRYESSMSALFSEDEAAAMEIIF